MRYVSFGWSRTKMVASVPLIYRNISDSRPYCASNQNRKQCTSINHRANHLRASFRPHRTKC